MPRHTQSRHNCVTSHPHLVECFSTSSDIRIDFIVMTSMIIFDRTLEGIWGDEEALSCGVSMIMDFPCLPIVLLVGRRIRHKTSDSCRFCPLLSRASANSRSSKSRSEIAFVLKLGEETDLEMGEDTGEAGVDVEGDDVAEVEGVITFDVEVRKVVYCLVMAARALMAFWLDILLTRSSKWRDVERSVSMVRLIVLTQSCLCSRVSVPSVHVWPDSEMVKVLPGEFGSSSAECRATKNLKLNFFFLVNKVCTIICFVITNMSLNMKPYLRFFCLAPLDFISYW